MTNSYIWVEVKTTNNERFFLKCQEIQVFLYDVVEEKDRLKIKILEKDFKKLQKIWFIKVKKVQDWGWKALKEKGKKYHIYLISLAIGLVFLYVISHIILSVEVIHSNQDIRFIVSNALNEKGIKKNTWKKDYQEIEKIKQEILDMYPEDLEWLEIETKGMKYIVRVEERKLEEEKNEPQACNVVASKDGIVKEMVYSSGEAVYKRNDSVKKGDILISGTIKKDEETRKTVCATGSVYAEVWYEVSVSIPLTYETHEKTGKVRWNIKAKNNGFNDFLFKSRLENYEEDATSLFTLFGTEFFFVKQYETTVKELVMNESTALDKALKEVDEKISLTLDEKEEIIAKKVLKKEINNSTMNVEVFVSVLEQIGERQEFVAEE